ncbi:MAG: SMP-30/gluconolactonase/LRE family protein [Phycisphaerales bacterium]|jgi:sugar lactone lactonase YvrE|nr:SMP-30/gluconolactonase/LRE family protein [Phycisphaerales bacterium]
METETELVVDDENLCGESPVWVAARAQLLWADVSAAKIFEHQPATNTRHLISKAMILSAIAINHDGRLVVASSNGLHLWSESGGCA